MKAAMGDLPSAAPMHAIADGYRAFERGDVDGGLAAITAGTRRAADRVRLRSRWAARSPPRTCSTSARCARSTAAARTRRCRRSGGWMRCRPSRSATSPPTRPTCWPGPARRRGDREAQRQARRRIADLARVASGPGRDRHGRGRTRVHAARRGEPPPAGRRGAVRARAAARARRRAVVRGGAGRGPGAGAGAALCDEHGLRRIGARVAAIRERRARRRVLAQLTTARARGRGARRRRASRTARSASASTSQKARCATTCRRRSPSSACRAGPSSAGSCPAEQARRRSLPAGRARHAFDHDDLARLLPRREPVRQPGVQFGRLAGCRSAT